MRSSIKIILAALFCVLANGLPYAQEKDTDVIPTEPGRIFLTDLYLQRGLPVGDNFAGKALEGGLGFGLRMQFYVLPEVYFGGSLTQDYMSVTDTRLVGSYTNVTKFNAYVYAGYDYRLNDSWNITADIGYGYSQNKNKQSSVQGGGKFRDTGDLLRLTSSIEYRFSPTTSFFLSPSYEQVFYDISTPSVLNDDFDTGSYFNLAVGIRISLRDYSSVPLEANDDQSLSELLSRDPKTLSISEKRKIYFLKKRQARARRRKK